MASASACLQKYTQVRSLPPDAVVDAGNWGEGIQPQGQVVLRCARVCCSHEMQSSEECCRNFGIFEGHLLMERLFLPASWFRQHEVRQQEEQELSFLTHWSSECIRMHFHSTTE